MKTFFYILMSFSFTFGCVKETGENNSDSLGPIEKHYVINYRDVDSIDYLFYETSNLPEIGITCFGTDIDSHWDYDNFIKYANLYGDTSFYQPASNVFNGNEGAILDTIESIAIFCDKSFNSTHNANENINDLVSVRYSCAREVLENNYFKDKYKYLSTAFYTERLDSFNLQENYLLGTNFNLTLLESPKYTDEYIFTIIYQEKGGLQISKEFSVVVLSGYE